MNNISFLFTQNTTQTAAGETAVLRGAQGGKDFLAELAAVLSQYGEVVGNESNGEKNIPSSIKNSEITNKNANLTVRENSSRVSSVTEKLIMSTQAKVIERLDSAQTRQIEGKNIHFSGNPAEMSLQLAVPEPDRQLAVTFAPFLTGEDGYTEEELHSLATLLVQMGGGDSAKTAGKKQVISPSKGSDEGIVQPDKGRNAKVANELKKMRAITEQQSYTSYNEISNAMLSDEAVVKEPNVAFNQKVALMKEELRQVAQLLTELHQQENIEPEEIAEVLTKYIQGENGAQTQEISSAIVYTTPEKARMEIPTAERYMKICEEMFKAAKDIISMVKVETYINEDDGSQTTSPQNTQAAQQAAPKETAGVVYDKSGGKFMSVMPSGNSLSLEAQAVVADNSGKPSSREEVQLFNSKHTMRAEVEEVVLETAKATDKNQPVQTTVSDRFEKTLDAQLAAASKETEKTADKPKTETRTAPVLGKDNASDRNVSADQGKENGSHRENMNPERATVAAPDKAAQAKAPVEQQSEPYLEIDELDTVRAETATPKASGSPEKPILSESAAFKTETADVKPVSGQNTNSTTTHADIFANRAEGKGTEIQPQPENRGAERVLQWQSVKDVANLAKMVQQAAQNGETKLTVRLNPENLGRMEIQLTEVNGRIDAKIMASSHESRNLLTSHGDAIRQQLLEKGIHIDTMDFSFNDSFARQEQEAQQQGERYGKQKSNPAPFSLTDNEEET